MKRRHATSASGDGSAYVNSTFTVGLLRLLRRVPLFPTSGSLFFVIVVVAVPLPVAIMRSVHISL